MSKLGEDELLRKTRKACKLFLAERVSLPPHERWPEFYQVVNIQDTSHEADAPALPEPIQPEPVAGSILSVEALVIPMDTKPEVLGTSPMPERKTFVKRISITNGALQPQPSPRSAPTIAVPCSEQLQSAHTDGWPLLILGSLAQESNDYKSERASCPRGKPKEPDKVPGIWSRELSLSKLEETRPFARSSTGSSLRVRPVPSASPRSDKDRRWSHIKIVSKTSKTNLPQDSPAPRAAPTLPNAVPAHSFQAPSALLSTKVVPR
jgi:hypothetical protein